MEFYDFYYLEDGQDWKGWEELYDSHDKKHLHDEETCNALGDWYDSCDFHVLDETVEKQLGFVSQPVEPLLKDFGMVGLASATTTLLHDDEYINLQCMTCRRKQLSQQNTYHD